MVYSGFSCAVLSSQFVSYHTHVCHVGFLSAGWYWYWENNKMWHCFLLSSYHITKLKLSDKNIRTHTWLKFQILPWSKLKVPAFLLFFSIPCCAKQNQEMLQNHAFEFKFRLWEGLIFYGLVAANEVLNMEGKWTCVLLHQFAKCWSYISIKLSKYNMNIPLLLITHITNSEMLIYFCDSEPHVYYFDSSTVFVLIAAHAPISTHPSYFETINQKMINHLPRSIHETNILSSNDWELAWKWPKS